MYTKSTKGMFMVDRSGNNLHIKKELSVLLSIFSCKWHVSMTC